MEQGGRRGASMGFTIVEVMIVLAVSSLIVLSALTLVNGRQSKTEFTTGINDFQEQLQQIINETASGQYPGMGGFTCQPAASGPVTFTTTSSSQGTNQGCIFLGKAVQFGLDTTESQLAVIPIAGKQYQPDGATPVASVGQAIPRAAWPFTIGPGDTEPQSLQNLTAIDPLEYGLHIASYNSACGVSSSPIAVCYEPTSQPGTYLQTGMAAFLFGDSSGTLASFSTSNGDIQSGSEQLSLYGVYSAPSAAGGGSQKGQSANTASLNLGNVPPTTTTMPNGTAPPGGTGMGWLQSASKVLVCVASGTTNQSGLITIGGGTSAGAGDGSLSVTLQVMEDQTC
ncbi:MAG TPA: prepilin-type N-terminal cleavage/methylation domain-containing protein [Verrucomicrobiae bacterium]|nr:prepilin-type N-terminal cleavage/methylation domain-containing protein [Verrucomicrobiae bacterium]